MKNNVFIIAEIGVNHNGKIELAKELIDIAKKSGADAVKFQTFVTENDISQLAPKAAYQKSSSNTLESQFEMVKRLELSKKEHIILKKYCDKNNIIFLSSPFDEGSVDFLNELDLNLIKIPSGEITHVPYLRKIGKINKPVILSTGMSTLEEVSFAVSFLYESGLSKDNLSLLHCTTEYPCPFEDVNLNAMLTLKEKFNVPVGYSDHTPGIIVSVAAVALGATIIEKHITLDKTLPGPDHKASLDPSEFESLVRSIRQIEVSLGDGKKIPAPSEMKNISVARKSIIAKKHILKGELLTEENIICKRPGSGISSIHWDDVIGKVASQDYEYDSFIID